MKIVIIIAVISIFTCLQSVYPQITTNELPVSVQKGSGGVLLDEGFKCEKGARLVIK